MTGPNPDPRTPPGFMDEGEPPRPMTAPPEPRPRGNTALWVFWHRLRGHWVHRSGWRVAYGRSSRNWRCVSCRQERDGRAPSFLEWRERG